MFVAGALAKPPVERSPSPPPYEQKQHAYAVRGLREYEDCLDEWELLELVWDEDWLCWGSCSASVYTAGLLREAENGPEER